MPSVADCSRVLIGYTPPHRQADRPNVADCSRVLIGYTRLVEPVDGSHVADCSRVLIGYTPDDTVTDDDDSCGLLPGSDRLHSMSSCSPAKVRLRIAPGF